ncbi:MAG: type 1 glutamine amidotransferase domain-containing protein [Thalassobaculales bacterium]
MQQNNAPAVEQTLAGRKIAILVSSGFNELEMTDPQRALLAAGAQVKIVSRDNGLVNGWHENSWGHFFPIDADLAQALAVDYDGLLIPGGPRGVAKLRQDAHARRFVRAFLRGNQPVVAIGEGAGVLIEGGIEGRQVTSAAEVKVELEAAGARWSEAAIVTDGALVTAQSTADRAELIAAMIAAFGAYRPEVNQAA